MVISRYNERRKILAEMCAQSLGLKELPEGLRALAVRYSDIPSRLLEDGVYSSLEEMSLYSMGVVYGYGPTLSFIAPDGHTCILPWNDIIIEELEKCGYVVCGYGKNKPDYCNPKDDSISSSIEAIDREREARKKVTLSLELAKRVNNQEIKSLSFLQLEGLDKVTFGEDGFAYDVFSRNLYRGSDLSHLSFLVVEALGYESEVARKFLAINAHGLSLSHPYDNVNDLESYLKYIQGNEFLNDELYYAPGGFYDQVSTPDVSNKGKK